MSDRLIGLLCKDNALPCIAQTAGGTLQARNVVCVKDPRTVGAT